MKLTDYLTQNGNTVNGVKLTQPQLNLVAKIDDLGVDMASGLPVNVRNPITGFEDTLHPFIAALVELTQELSYSYSGIGPMNFEGHKVPIQTYDRIKYLVLALDSEAYGNFID